ncbi:MAG: prepilin-type N-terminal cleavage/methylation domain-containing protein [Planctomycetes bacterium]|nr:prepilin-type N-terminal cleavage/methylation domain-containing protein [Planctomycetota bacterium]
MRTTHPEKQTGFTLVEMLVVIAIIGILAAILVPTLAGAIRSAKIAAIALETKNLANAIEAYKSKIGDYPPDFSSSTAVQAHLRKAYNRNTMALSTWYTNPPWDAGPAGAAPVPNPADLDPAEALVFWLSAVSTDPRAPLNIDSVGSGQTTSGAKVISGPGEPVSFFEFDETRLTDLDDDGWPEYAPKQAPEAPYVYFDGRVNSGTYAYNVPTYTLSGGGTVRPYRSNSAINVALDKSQTTPSASPNNTTWLNPGKFQLISAGLDEHFGSISITSPNYKQYPDPNYTLADEDDDNLADFSEGKTMGDSVP